jgi:hypothetical protein
MSPDYPRSGNFYTLNDQGVYTATEPPDGIDLSTVPHVNRAERRRQECIFRRTNKGNRSRGW